MAAHELADGPPSARNERARALFAGLGGDYDRWAAILSFGQDPRWRRFLVRRVEVGRAAHVLDVATGTAAVARALVHRYGCRVTGIDQSPEMLDGARRRLGPAERDQIELQLANAERLPFPDEAFDGLTCTYLLRYVEDPEATLRELVRVVRAGGPVGYLEFALPPPGPLRAAWRLYTGVLLPWLGGLVAPAWGDVGRFLGPSITAFCTRYPPDELAEAFRRAGLEDVRYRRLSLGGGIVLWGTRARPGRGQA